MPLIMSPWSPLAAMLLVLTSYLFRPRRIRVSRGAPRSRIALVRAIYTFFLFGDLVFASLTVRLFQLFHHDSRYQQMLLWSLLALLSLSLVLWDSWRAGLWRRGAGTSLHAT